MLKEVLLLIGLLIGISSNQRIEIDDACNAQFTYVKAVEACKDLISTCPDAEYKKNKKQTLQLCPDDIYNNYNHIVCCFYTSESPLIVGAGGIAVIYSANYSVYPHMAHIGYDSDRGKTRWLCGGSLINEKFVLTAAHCLSDEDHPAKYVKLGIVYLNVTYPHVQDINITRRIAHPDYNSSSHYHDIGLLELQKPATINAFVKPACLYRNPEILEKNLVATGWGAKSYGGPGSDVLLEIDMTLFDNPSCNASYKNHVNRRLKNGIIDDIQFCAGGLPGGEEKDTCEGDSGGPVHLYDKKINKFYIVGVTSFGIACGPIPGVYVRVSYYNNWIQSQIWPHPVNPNQNLLFGCE